MGDLSRFRQFLFKEGFSVNRNYKSMEKDKLFLSTVNSSKGLERPFVFMALTFPLELAFANFSNDLVVNLISVGLSRCKQHVSFCVPIYSDRFSEVLHLYPDCPKPKEGIVSNKKHVSSQEETLYDVLHRSHSTTEILKQGILSFRTRELLRSCAKYVGNNPYPPGPRVRWTMRNEEEASFMGILYEVLITSLWTKRWPELDVKGMNEILHNPMYLHCRQNIQKKFQKLVTTFQKPYFCHFDTLYDYTEYHILLSQKIRVRVSPQRKQEMKSVWEKMRHDISSLQPRFPVQKAQVNLHRTMMTGVADMICKQQRGADEEQEDIILYEIKTCSSSDWKEDAFTQAALYMSMTRQKKGVVRLLNPFRRELHEYHISLLSKEKQVLVQVDRELLLWNFNCFLAKFKHNLLAPPLPRPIQEYMCGNHLEFLASTKARIVDMVPLDKVVLHPTHPIFSKPLDMAYLLDSIGHKPEMPPPDMINDPFFLSILLGVHLRQSYSFR